MPKERNKADGYREKAPIKREKSDACIDSSEREVSRPKVKAYEGDTKAMENQRPNPNETFPNPKIPSLCYIKNVVKNPRIIIGDYTYYDDVDGADQFEKHVTHFYDFIGDKLIIGRFCAIAKGVSL